METGSFGQLTPGAAASVPDMDHKAQLVPLLVGKPVMENNGRAGVSPWWDACSDKYSRVR